MLDVGCGSGGSADTAEGRYLGIDVAAETIDLARQRFRNDPRKTFELLDARRDEIPGRFYAPTSGCRYTMMLFRSWSEDR